MENTYEHARRCVIGLYQLYQYRTSEQNKGSAKAYTYQHTLQREELRDLKLLSKMHRRAWAVEIEEILASRGELPGRVVAAALEDAAEVDGEVSAIWISK